MSRSVVQDLSPVAEEPEEPASRLARLGQRTAVALRPRNVNRRSVDGRMMVTSPSRSRLRSKSSPERGSLDDGDMLLDTVADRASARGATDRVSAGLLVALVMMVLLVLGMMWFSRRAAPISCINSNYEWVCDSGSSFAS